MTSGYYRMHRGWMDHPMFKPEPYTDREAFMWLIENAAWKDGRKRVGAITVEVKRGQVAASLRFMACAWKWQEPKVRRFLSRMKIDAAIDAASDAGVNVITICNYDKFQTDAHAADAPTDAAIDAASTQTRIKKEEVKKEDTEADASGAVAPAQGGLELATVDGEPAPKKIYYDLARQIDPSKAFVQAATTWLQLHDGDAEAATPGLMSCQGKEKATPYLWGAIQDLKARNKKGARSLFDAGPDPRKTNRNFTGKWGKHWIQDGVLAGAAT